MTITKDFDAAASNAETLFDRLMAERAILRAYSLLPVEKQTFLRQVLKRVVSLEAEQGSDAAEQALETVIALLSGTPQH